MTMKGKALVLALLLACASVTAQAAAGRGDRSGYDKYRDAAACALSILVNSAPPLPHLAVLACTKAILHWIV
jgi:hypothetical protein